MSPEPQEALRAALLMPTMVKQSTTVNSASIASELSEFCQSCINEIGGTQDPKLAEIIVMKEQQQKLQLKHQNPIVQEEL